VDETLWVIEILTGWALANLAVSICIDWRKPAGPDWRAFVFAPWYALWHRKRTADRPRCPHCGLPHDLTGWPSAICENARKGEL
jgi:hypothetical protein